MRGAPGVRRRTGEHYILSSLVPYTHTHALPVHLRETRSPPVRRCRDVRMLGELKTTLVRFSAYFPA